MRAEGGLRHRIRRALGVPPPVQVGLRAPDPGMNPEATRETLELALRVGEAMLALGAAAVDVTAAMRRIVRAFGLVGCQVDLTFTSITLSYDRGLAGQPVTMMRVVRDRVPDYGRLAQVFEMVREIGDEEVPRDRIQEKLEAAHTHLDRIVTAPYPYSRWVVSVVLGGLAGAVAVLLGGGPAVVAVAAVTTVLIDQVTWALGRWGLPPFFLQTTGAGIATLVAVGLFLAVPHLPVELRDLPPSLVVAAGVVVLLAGLSVVGSAEDAISGFPLTAAARGFEVLVLTLGIVVGIGAVLDIARRAGVALEVIVLPPSQSALLLRTLAGAAAAAAWALACYAGRRATAVAALAGGAAWLIFAVLRDLGAGPALASAAAALVVGFVSESTARRTRVPPIVTSVCGIIPLLPGLAIYRGLFHLVNEPNAGLGPGVAELLGAALIGLGLAGGVTLGEFLAAPLRLGIRPRRFIRARRRRHV